MDFYTEQIENVFQKTYVTSHVKVGKYTYGFPTIEEFGNDTTVEIGKFCSIAGNVRILLGGSHRSEWCTTYPFNVLMKEFGEIKGHPQSKGDILIGHDVWIGYGAVILHGVHIGNGCIIGANTVVTKDIEPYTIVVGNPVKEIRKRFSESVISRLQEICWWDWEDELIFKAIPLLQSDRMEELFAFYEKYVRK